MRRLLTSMSFTCRLAIVVTLFLLAGNATRAAAQTNRDASIKVVVVDQTGAVIVNAAVRLQPIEPAGPTVDAVTNDQGEAAFAGLAPGRYAVRAEFPGFDPKQLDDVRVRAGGMARRELKLSIAKVAEDVVVGQDPRDRALVPRGNAFGNLLTRAQIEALPDDPDEMEEALKEMAGPGATIRVDGFRGGKLPPKSQIQSIRFRRDLFAAENHGGGMVFVDIHTLPGGGPLRGSVDFTFRDESLNARNAFAPRRSPEQQQNGTFTLNGTLVKNRTGFSITTNGVNAYDSKTLNAVTPDRSVSGSIRRPADRANFSARLDHALTKSRTLRASYQRSGTKTENLGVGDFDLPSRAYSRDTSEDVFRLSLSGPVGKNFYNETRFQSRRQSSASASLTDAPALMVLDAFNTGGAQVGGGRDGTDFEIATDLDYAVGRHSARAGFLFEGGRYRSDEVRNSGGTFTFASLDAYDAGTPTTFTQRSGDPLVKYGHAQFGWYVQDDVRVARSLSMSFGLRHEIQTHTDDYLNFAPRFGATWSPFKNGSTTLRGGVGIFYDWYDAQTYEQTLRVDGTHQVDLVVQNPGFPDPFDGADTIVLPSSRYLQSPDLTLPRTLRTNAGVERVVGKFGRLVAGYSYGRGENLFRGRNINAPLEDGTRPNPDTGNITQIESTASSRTHVVNTGFNLNLPWHRTFLFVNYSFAKAQNDTDGPFSLPADSYDLAAEWGPASNDVRHRLTGMFNMNLWKGFKLATSFNANSATPYTITTGHDDNGDTVSNDRPAGIGRNTARAADRWDVGARLSYTFGFGQRAGADGGGGPQVIM
ncbi:MAG TPA: carboxypeptidase regulatory-like domain-containing protein, partial [Vicinamibacterales bacterium]|nr:carboxypeptidase regulatory-like domain-containing protein [Vicinamibacterales bacterium]